MLEAGLKDTAPVPSVLYRVVGPDQTITYSNIRPTRTLLLRRAR
jgi:hypothetical protein